MSSRKTFEISCVFLYPIGSYRFLESCLLSPFKIGDFLFLTFQPFLRPLREILLVPWPTGVMGISERHFAIALTYENYSIVMRCKKTLPSWPGSTCFASSLSLWSEDISDSTGGGSGLLTLNSQPTLGFLFSLETDHVEKETGSWRSLLGTHSYLCFQSILSLILGNFVFQPEVW